MNSEYLVPCEKCENESITYDWHCEGCKARFQVRMLEAKNTVYTRYDSNRNTVTLDEEVEE